MNNVHVHRCLSIYYHYRYIFFIHVKKCFRIMLLPTTFCCKYLINKSLNLKLPYLLLCYYFFT
nr:MAG TPA: hypothetical protein [Caudoviricetes sp.]